ncbi:MAG: hypothetical protein EXS36_16825 [Pedosphaera sp.]|nr:hypothetical protein [Pedosphaera sp.]
MNFDFKNRQQLLTTLALGFIGLWAAESLLITPLVRSWISRNGKIKILRKQVRDGELLIHREQGIRNRWNEMLTNTLPSEVSAAESLVLGAFDGWSRESRVSIMSIKPQWKRNDDDYMVLECRVDAAGSLSTITRFLYEIEHDPLALKVNSVELSSRDTTGSPLTLGLQVSGLVLSTEKR